jgi:dTDP-glucose 4,6-dehydratase/UDP-glucuronate decarboxylase
MKDKLCNFKNKSILITGANGLLGGFLSDFFSFLNEKYDYNIKLYLTSLSESQNAERLSHLIEKKYIKYIQCDLSAEQKDCLFEPTDYVFFMSGYGQPKKFIENKLKTIMLNTNGLNYLLKINKKSNFLFASTSEIYGEPDEENLPTKEDYNGNYSIESNRSCYISSKRLGEVICLEHARDNVELNIKIARIALTYGPGVLMNDNRVLQDFIIKGNNNKIINLMDEGSAIRNYIYIVDCVEIILNILLSGKKNIYNVGGDREEITIYELAKVVGEVINVDVLKGQQKQDFVSKSPSKVALDMSRYQNEFGKNNSFISLREGIKNTVKWLKLG